MNDRNLLETAWTTTVSRISDRLRTKNKYKMFFIIKNKSFYFFISFLYILNKHHVL